MNDRRFTLAALVFTLFMPTAPISAQEQSRATVKEQLQSLSPMVGVWQRESDGADGATQTNTTVIRWSADEAYLRITSSERLSSDPESRRNLGTTLVGWDPETSQLRAWVFYHNAQLSGPATIADGVLTLELKGKALVSGEDSPETSGTFRFKLEQDRLAVSFSDLRMGDQVMDDGTLVSTRMTPDGLANADDDVWKAEEWEKLTGDWRADLPNGGYRIKRIKEGEEILEAYNPQGELVMKSRCNMTIERHEGIAFFTATDRVRLDTDSPTPVAGSYTSIYKVHDGRWYEQLRGIFADSENFAPDRFLVYSRDDESVQGASAASVRSEPAIGLVRVEYMSVPEGGDEAYLEVEHVWKQIHKARRAAGKLEHWAVYRVERDRGGEADYNYAVVHVFKSPEQISQGVDYAELVEGLEWGDEEQATYERTADTREMVRSDFWAIEAVVDPERLNNPSREPAKTIRVGLMTSTDAAEHLRLEKDFWAKLWAERVRKGELRNWMLMSRQSGSGHNMIGVMVAPDSELERINIAELVRAAFPEADPEELRRQLSKTPQVRVMDAYETWTLVEGLDPIEEN